MASGTYKIAFAMGVFSNRDSFSITFSILQMTVFSEEQHQKQFDFKLVTDDGISIDSREEQT